MFTDSTLPLSKIINKKYILIILIQYKIEIIGCTHRETEITSLSVEFESRFSNHILLSIIWV